MNDKLLLRSLHFLIMYFFKTLLISLSPKGPLFSILIAIPFFSIYSKKQKMLQRLLFSQVSNSLKYLLKIIFYVLQILFHETLHFNFSKQEGSSLFTLFVTKILFLTFYLHLQYFLMPHRLVFIQKYYFVMLLLITVFLHSSFSLVQLRHNCFDCICCLSHVMCSCLHMTRVTLKDFKTLQSVIYKECLIVPYLPLGCYIIISFFQFITNIYS